MTHEFYLASYPRSGNTMTRLLLEHHFDIDTREENMRVLHEHREDLQHLQTKHDDCQGIAYKTHTNDHDVMPALVLVRDGRDAIVSFAHYSIDIMGVERDFKELLASRVGGKQWSECYQWWAGGRPGNHLYAVISYEQLLRHRLADTTPYYLQAALRKIGFDFEIKKEHPLPGFDQYHKANSKFFRRGIVGSWKDEMPVELEEEFWKSNGVVMEWLGYER